MTTLGKTLLMGHSLIVAALIVMVAPTPTVTMNYPAADHDVVAEQLSIATSGRDCTDGDHPFLTDHVIIEREGLVMEVTFDAALKLTTSHAPISVLAYCK